MVWRLDMGEVAFEIHMRGFVCPQSQRQYQLRQGGLKRLCTNGRNLLFEPICQSGSNGASRILTSMFGIVLAPLSSAISPWTPEPRHRLRPWAP